MTPNRRSASTAGSRPSSSTDGAAKPASLRDLMELRERHQAATQRETEARLRREQAQTSIATLERELGALGYNEKVNGDFDAWYDKEIADLDETMTDIENLLNEALG